MNFLKKYNALKIIVSILLIAIGLLFCIFSAHPKMDIFLGYLFASVLLLIALGLIVITFINENRNFFRVLLYLLVVGLSVIIYIFPTIFVLSMPIFIGVFFIGAGIIFIIKFIILKRVSLKSLFNLFQLLGCLILIVVGLLFCIFYNKIDVYITSFIIGIPLFALGVVFLIFTIISMINNKNNSKVNIYIGDYKSEEKKSDQKKKNDK